VLYHLCFHFLPARLCHSTSSVCLSVCLWRSGRPTVIT